MKRKIYYEMATEYFGKDAAAAKADNFWLTDADFSAYDPGAIRPDWESNDPVPALDNVFTEDRKSVLVSGVPMHLLPKLQPYPTNLLGLYEQMRAKRAAMTNPDTGGPMADGSRIHPSPAFPNDSHFTS